MDEKTNEIKDFAITRLDSYEISYKWAITNFSFWADQELSSPSFGMHDLGLMFHIKFCYVDEMLTLKLNKETDFLHKNDCKKLTLNFSLMNEDSVVFTKTRNYFLTKVITNYSIPMANLDELVQAKPTLFLDKIMRILCKIIVYTGKMTSVGWYDENVMSESFFVEQLSNGLKSFFQCDKLSDVVLTSNGKQFPAHKIILSAQSAVFNAMFQSNMTEAQENEVIIDDIEPKVLQEMLRYMYTGKVEQLSEIETELLCAANKYDVVGLKLKCSKALIQNMTTGNVVEILILADQHDAKLLKTRALNFIAININELLEMQDFNEFMSSNPDLRNDIIRASI